MDITPYLKVIFWLSFATILFTYLGYPLFVLARGWLVRRPLSTTEANTYRPKVTLIVAAYNERASIGDKLRNLCQLRYPAGKLEILVASDGSHDGTNELVSEFADQGITLLALPRRGKAATLNAAVARSTGEILVFSDANSMYRPDAIEQLVAPMADPTVGGVAGNQVYSKGKNEGMTGEGERWYWNFDRLLKFSQSRSGSVISATGAIYAIRRDLFRQVPEGVTDDFVTSTRVIQQGHRLVFAPDAVAVEPVASSTKTEFGRKVRVITRGLRGVLEMRSLLNPLRYGSYSVDLVSHKVLRRLVAIPLLALFLSSLCLANTHSFYAMMAMIQAMFYGLALTGALLTSTRWGRSRLFTIPFFFCMVNLAAIMAVLELIRGRKVVLWEPQRHEPKAA